MKHARTQPMLRVFDANAEAAEIEAAVEEALAMRAASMRLPVIADPPPPVVVEPQPTAQGSAPIASVPVADVEPGRSWVARIFALGMLAATVAALAWLGVQIALVLTDSWVAPLHLSPQSDAVASLRLQHQRHLAELARLDAEVTRIDGELEAIDAAIKRVENLRGSTDATLTWQADQMRVEASGLSTTATLLRRQRDQVRELQKRQQDITKHAREDLAAGLVDRTVVDREEQVLDRLAVEATDLDRQLAEVKARKSSTRSTLRALDERDLDGAARLPELVAGDERDTRIEIEIQRLNAEARGHRAQRAAATASVANQRTLLAELEARPLYRAMSQITDVAFVPYDQLEGIEPGARVLACTWGLFACHQVGTIAEILPGEVVTQDPWGELARGQYLVLKLDDKDAVRERLLRVRE
jgi:hypothetical protein